MKQDSTILCVCVYSVHCTLTVHGRIVSRILDFKYFIKLKYALYQQTEKKGKTIKTLCLLVYLFLIVLFIYFFSIKNKPY